MMTGQSMGSHVEFAGLNARERSLIKTIREAGQWRLTTASSPWIGSRWIAWPTKFRAFHRVGIGSSRVGRDWGQRASWFHALRTICAHIDVGEALLVTAPGTTTHRFVDRCADLFGIHSVTVQPPAPEMELAEWLKDLQSAVPSESQYRHQALVSPTFGENAAAQLADIPLVDRLVVAMSDTLHVLAIRSRGNWEQLVRARLLTNDAASGCVFISVDDSLVKAKLSKELMSLGAIGHYTWLPASEVEPCFEPVRQVQRPAGRVVSLPPESPWPFLSHWTRRCDGPWPEQSTESYLDELILGSAGSDHSAFASLMRIVHQRRIVASSRAIRGKTPIVSFTEVPITRLPELRTFRSHRARWDFEPYGISIDQKWLQRLGVRPVKYGDDQLWEELPEEQQPFFQKAESRRSIDWTVEREWRCVGDVNLACLSSDNAMLFVPSQEEAWQIASISPWPVTVLTSPPKS